MGELQREASGLRETVQHNESVLVRQKRELDVAKEEAVAMIRRAEERIQETEQPLALQMAKLEELEGWMNEAIKQRSIGSTPPVGKRVQTEMVAKTGKRREAKGVRAAIL
ncbi:hypothetical protein LOK74_21010 [Brevibacillus humidisoli]|uniref:hypothetical protein n=1 Tax=Brevibacillus humidisoli TaxID=2895522 RepID=UPI001E349578|nr:hypothetical protein [Brevibacillus humidisoli]UFJ40482.1 hypothetical protein LOK74_21010 [Brevibacillus humidisoli]